MPAKTHIALSIVLVLVAANASSSPHADSEEDAIFRAVFRQVADGMVDDSLLAEGGVACLSIDPGGARQSVSKEFLEGLGSGPVRRGAECERRPDGAVELATDRPAILITAGPIDWVAEDDAWVSVEYFRTALESALRVYRVVFLGRSGDALSVSVKLPSSNLLALDLPFASPTGHGLARGGWVTARFGKGEPPPMDLLTRWIEESYRAVALRRLVEELDARGEADS